MSSKDAKALEAAVNTEEAKLENLVLREEEILERGQWSGKLDFLLSCLGYAVGLGNVWRFPYLCFKHGGGAFLIPYTIMLIFIGIPIFFLEISMGQYTAMGPVTLYANIMPAFKGLGLANFFSSTVIALYYNMLIAWTIYYTYASFTSELPWEKCDHDFNSEFCFSIEGYKTCLELKENGTNEDAVYHNGTCITQPSQLLKLKQNSNFFYRCETENLREGVYLNESYCDVHSLNGSSPSPSIVKPFDIPPPIRKTAAQEYLTNSVLNESSGLEDMGPIQWHLALSLLVAWIVIFLALFKGIKSSGKVVYFTAIFPYVVLVILFFRAITLPGAYQGIHFYMVPKWERLSDVRVWEGAAVQIFFSLSVASGGLVTLASYNPIHNNVLRDTMIVCFGNCLTSVFAGFAIFSVLGFLAHELDVEVENVVQSGTGLAFIAYPDLVTRLPISPLWAIIFFLMLFTLGLDSQFAIVETILSGILDFRPTLRRYKTSIIGMICIIGFLLGLPLTTRGGGYLLDLLDYYAAGFPYLIGGLVELVIFGHLYGMDKVFEDLYHIMKLDPQGVVRLFLEILYKFISPAIITIILILSWVGYQPLTKGDYIYPTWANGIGWIIAIFIILPIPVMFIYQIFNSLFFKYESIHSMSEKWSKVKRELFHETPKYRENFILKGDDDHIKPDGHFQNKSETHLYEGKDNMGME